LFWLGVPAAAAAKAGGLSAKTVSKRYNRLRERIAADREAELEKLEGHIEVDESYFGGHRKGKREQGAGGKIPVCGLLKRGDEVRVILPPNCSEKHLLGVNLENVLLDSSVYSDGWKAYNKLSLNGFHHRRINHQEEFANGKNHINGIENFWGYAKRRLKAYHGGFKRNFRLFIREMEFRFNHRNDENTLDDLQDALLNWSAQVTGCLEKISFIKAIYETKHI
jgi:transposase